MTPNRCPAWCIRMELREPLRAKHSTGRWGREGSQLLNMFSEGEILCGAEPDPFGDAVPVHLRLAVALGPAKG